MFTLLLRHGEKRVIDIRASRRVVVTSVAAVPVRVRIEHRGGGGWVPLGSDLLLRPGARWSRAKEGIPGDNLAVGVDGAPGADAVRVCF
jgi:hypothetical protein